MAQSRLFNYLEDDLTSLLNRWHIGSIPFGRYWGFEWDGGVALAANFIHTNNGIVLTNSDTPITTTAPSGEWKTKQGGVIREDAAISATFAANPSGDPRIDLLVGQHNYLASAGGAAATYVVITGTPAASPVAPNLTVPNEQVILGQMLVPAGAIDLSNAIFTLERHPDFAGDTTIAHTDIENNFIEEQRISNITKEWGVCFIDVPAKTIDLTKDSTGTSLTGDALRINLGRNRFFIEQILGTPQTIINVIPYPHSFNREAKEYEFYTFTNLKLGGTNFIADAGTQEVHIKQASYFKLTSIQDFLGTGLLSGVYSVESGGEANTFGTNYFYGLNAWNKNNTTSVNAAGIITHNFIGNFIEVATTPATSDITAIQSFRGSGGTFMVVRADGEPLTLIHNSPAAVTKKLWLPNETDITSRRDSEIFLFVEDANYWRLVGTYDEVDNWHYVGDVGTGLGTTFSGYGNNILITQDKLRFKKFADGIVKLLGQIVKLDVTDPLNNVVFTLPVGYRPAFTVQLGGVVGIYYSTPAGVSQFNAPVLVTVLPSGNITLTGFSGFEQFASPPALTAAISNVILNFEFSLD